MEPGSSINPWVRSNQEQPTPETRDLLGDEFTQARYDKILTELGASGMALNELYAAIPAAQVRFTAAQEARRVFFEERQ